MKQFTCTEVSLKFVNADTGAVATMQQGDVLTLQDTQVAELCARGWGTAAGVDTGERKPGAVTISV